MVGGIDDFSASGGIYQVCGNYRSGISHSYLSGISALGMASDRDFYARNTRNSRYPSIESGIKYGANAGKSTERPVMFPGINVVYDATHANIAALPPHASYAGYVTGTPDIVWTPDDWKKYPDALRIDQTPVNTPWDATADGDDYERGAVALTELAPRAKLRIESFKNAVRPGQRLPFVYMSANDVTNVANALVNGGVTSGVSLFVANWNLTEPAAVADVIAAAGPFPIVGVQFTNTGPYDISVFSTHYFTTRSEKPVSVRTLLGYVTYIEETFRANWTDFESKRVVSTDHGATWH